MWHIASFVTAVFALPQSLDIQSTMSTLIVDLFVKGKGLLCCLSDTDMSRLRYRPPNKSITTSLHVALWSAETCGLTLHNISHCMEFQGHTQHAVRFLWTKKHGSSLATGS